MVVIGQVQYPEYRQLIARPSGAFRLIETVAQENISQVVSYSGGAHENLQIAMNSRQNSSLQEAAILELGKRVFPIGTQYAGAFQEGAMLSQGVVFYGNGACYQGNLVGHRPEGLGTMFYPNGDRYLGNWVGGHQEGQGTCLCANRVVYQGNWVGGHPEGLGTMFYPNGDRYLGHWVGGHPEGQGTFLCANRVVYQGNWVGGHPEGQGTIFYANGDCYQGNWKDSCRHGQGTAWFDNNKQYVGNWVAGSPHGEGTFRDANQFVYRGNWVSGKPHGRGTIFYVNGDCYQGNWINGHREGQGTEWRADAGCYQGNWVNGRKEGMGMMWFPNGSYYAGQWVGNRMEGRGAFWKEREGLCMESTWNNGEPSVGSIVKYVFPDGGLGASIDYANGFVETSCEQLSDRLFLTLLVGIDKMVASMNDYPLGIMIDYLQKNGYLQPAEELICAQRIYRAKKIERVQIIKEILSQKRACLMTITVEGHALGLRCSVRESSWIDCVLYNSGYGLDYHKYRVGDSKYQTGLHVRIPIKELSFEKILSIVNGSFRTVVAWYECILRTPGATIIEQETPVWQTSQKVGNCSLEWIFAYLKNTMEDYTEMRKGLFVECLAALNNKASRKMHPVIRKQLQEELQRKIIKRTK